MEPYFIGPSTSFKSPSSIVDPSTSELCSPKDFSRNFELEAALGTGKFRKIKIVPPKDVGITQKSSNNKDEDFFYFVDRGDDRDGKFNPWAVETIHDSINYTVFEENMESDFYFLLSSHSPESILAYQPIAELLFNHRSDCKKRNADDCCVMNSHDYWTVTVAHYGIYRTRCWEKLMCEACCFSKFHIKKECYDEALELEHANSFFNKLFSIMTSAIQNEMKIRGVKNTLALGGAVSWQQLVDTLHDHYAIISVDVSNIEEGLESKLPLLRSDKLDCYSEDDEKAFYFLNPGDDAGDLKKSAIAAIKKQNPEGFKWHNEETTDCFIGELAQHSQEDIQPVAKLIYEHQQKCSSTDGCEDCVLTVPKSWFVTKSTYGIYRMSSYDFFTCNKCRHETFHIEDQRFDRLIKLEYAEKCISSLGQFIHISHKTDEEKVDLIKGLIEKGKSQSWPQLAEKCQLLEDKYVQRVGVSLPVEKTASEATEVRASSEQGADIASEELEPSAKRQKLSP